MQHMIRSMWDLNTTIKIITCHTWTHRRGLPCYSLLNITDTFHMTLSFTCAEITHLTWILLIKCTNCSCDCPKWKSSSMSVQEEKCSVVVDSSRVHFCSTCFIHPGHGRSITTSDDLKNYFAVEMCISCNNDIRWNSPADISAEKHFFLQV